MNKKRGALPLAFATAFALSAVSAQANMIAMSVGNIANPSSVNFAVPVSSNAYANEYRKFSFPVWEGLKFTFVLENTSTFYDFDVYYAPSREFVNKDAFLASLIKVGETSSSSKSFTFEESSQPTKIRASSANQASAQGYLHFVPKYANAQATSVTKLEIASISILNQSDFDADALTNVSIMYPSSAFNVLPQTSSVFSLASIDTSNSYYENNRLYFEKGYLHANGVTKFYTPSKSQAAAALPDGYAFSTWNFDQSASCFYKIIEPGEVNGNGFLYGDSYGSVGTSDTSKTLYPFTYNLYCPNVTSGNPADWFLNESVPSQSFDMVFNRLGTADLHNKVVVTPSATAMRRFADTVSISVADPTSSYCSSVSYNPDYVGTDGQCKISFDKLEGTEIVSSSLGLVMSAETTGVKKIDIKLLKKEGGKWYFVDKLSPVSISVTDVSALSIDPASTNLVVKKGQRLTTNSLLVSGEASSNVKLSVKNSSGQTLLEEGAETLSLQTSSSGSLTRQISTRTDAQVLSVDARSIGDTVPLTVAADYAYDLNKVKSASQTINVKVMPSSDMAVSPQQTTATVYNDKAYTLAYRIQLMDQPSLAFSESNFGAGWTASVKVRETGTSNWNASPSVVGTYANGQLSVSVDGQTLVSGKAYELLVEFTNPTLNNVVVSGQQSFSVVANSSVSGSFNISNTSAIAGMPVTANLTLDDMTDSGLLNVQSIAFKYRKSGDTAWINSSTSEISNNGLTMTKLMTTGGNYDFMVITTSKSGMAWESPVKSVAVSSSAVLDVAFTNNNIQLFKTEKAVVELVPGQSELRTLDDAVILVKSARDGSWMKFINSASPIDAFASALDVQQSLAIENVSATLVNGKLELINQGSTALKNDMANLTFLAIDKSLFNYWAAEIAAGRATESQAKAAIEKIMARAKVASGRVTWNVAKAPRLQVAGLYSNNEAGVTQNILITAGNSISRYSGDFNKVKGFFVGVDGQNIPIEIVNGAAQIAWTPNIDTVDPVGIAPESRIHLWYENEAGNKIKNPVANKVSSWGDDFVRVFRMNTFNYLFPTYSLNVSLDYQFAPAQFNVKLASAPVSQYQLRKFPMTYTWSVVNNDTAAVDSVTFRANKERFYGEFKKSGTYTLTLNYIDGKGNTGVATQVLEILEPVAMEITLKDSFSNAFMRAPLSASVTAMINGGHKKERIANAKWYIDDALVKNVSTGVLTRNLFSDIGQGEKVIKVELTTTLGRTFTTSKTYSVNENQLPVCQAIEKQSYASYDRYTVTCSDSDGKIRSYKWMINGEVATPISYRISVPKTTSVSSISVQAVDDTGAESISTN